jgi:hypothetical protein
MAAPCINIESVSRYKISNVSGMNESIVYFFSSDQVLKDFVAKAGGVSHDTGVTVGKADNLYPGETLYPRETLYPYAYILPIGILQRFEVLASELGGDGTYRINIYGMNEAGEWTAYGG